ncbi:DUF6519 domain-containing protein [Streptantibioticus cattleyicolor]|uniref:DUF6519 domain-containing protein n=1 Tax=Streptantibioticus cattleyicolor TaxID=29303 RepID=UPI000A45E6B7|nr:DUF6519 domain-containing protein [Streptantibioticus cattleyicolor]
MTDLALLLERELPDADANERAAIELHRARTLAADLIGRHGGPAGAAGFAIGYRAGHHDLADLAIGGGRYYVDGILCDATRPTPGTAVPPDDAAARDADAPDPSVPPPPAGWTYWDQPDAYRDPERAGDRLPDRFPFLAHLKVWERSVSAVEDPAIREVALGAALPDTVVWRKVVWQVLPLDAGELPVPDGGAETVRAAFDAWARPRQRAGGRLAVRTRRPDGADDEPCLARPDAAYRGPENQLHRIEVHRGGTAAEGASFMWSRENGSVVFPVTAVEGTWVDLATLGDDDRLTLDPGDLVEVADSATVSRLEAFPLSRVEEVDLPGRRVRLSGEPAPGVGRLAARHPFLRRWDHPATGAEDGAPPITEGAWTDLEDGVQVWFEPGGTYRTGDHWLVPARTLTGTVEWPQDTAGDPLLQPPAGITTRYAPLAWVMGADAVLDLRHVFAPLTAAASVDRQG